MTDISSINDRDLRFEPLLAQNWAAQKERDQRCVWIGVYVMVFRLTPASGQCYNNRVTHRASNAHPASSYPLSTTQATACHPLCAAIQTTQRQIVILFLNGGTFRATYYGTRKWITVTVIKTRF
jgi:hypothetical protein